MTIDPTLLILLLLVLAVVVVAPIIGFVLLFRRIKARKRRFIFTACYFGFPLAALFCFGFVGNSHARIERDHSLTLPKSASHIRCGGLVSLTTFGDFPADASFEISSEDLPALLSKFKWASNTETNDIVPLNERMTVPLEFGQPTSSHYGKSRDGNSVYLQTYETKHQRVGICIYTMWN